jgi:hypothetical protein
MTFAELAEARGTSKRAAVVLVRRHGWRRQRNNAGHVIALVTPAWTEPTAGDGGEGHSERHDPEPAPFPPERWRRWRTHWRPSVRGTPAR